MDKICLATSLIEVRVGRETGKAIVEFMVVVASK